TGMTATCNALESTFPTAIADAGDGNVFLALAPANRASVDFTVARIDGDSLTGVVWARRVSLAGKTLLPRGATTVVDAAGNIRGVVIVGIVPQGSALGPSDAFVLAFDAAGGPLFADGVAGKVIARTGSSGATFSQSLVGVTVAPASGEIIAVGATAMSGE